MEFPQPADVKVGTVGEVSLGAKSNSGLKVRYYVREGPAEIVGDSLRFTSIPPRSRFPVKVTVVAWQWGDRQINTAEPVERSFLIVR